MGESVCMSRCQGFRMLDPLPTAWLAKPDNLCTIHITCVFPCNMSSSWCSGADRIWLNNCRQITNWNMFSFCCLNKTAARTVSFHIPFHKRTWQGKAACSSMHFIHAENWKKRMKCKDGGQNGLDTWIVAEAGCVQIIVTFRAEVYHQVRLWLAEQKAKGSSLSTTKPLLSSP